MYFSTRKDHEEFMKKQNEIWDEASRLGGECLHLMLLEYNGKKVTKEQKQSLRDRTIELAKKRRKLYGYSYMEVTE